MLEVFEVAKRYKNGRGIGPVSFTIDSGEVMGIVGPNGSGKSTLFNALAGILDTDAGQWKLNGLAFENLQQCQYGFLPESPFFFPKLKVTQFCHFDATMRGIDISADEVATFLREFGCESILNEKMRNLSQGLAKRVALACAFLGAPDLIVLDEPINSLDIKSVIVLKELIARSKARGASILLSSHLLDFIDEVADRVIFLDEGLFVDEFKPREKKAEEAYKENFMPGL